MKSILITLLLLVGYNNISFAQKKFNPEEMVGFTCFFGGTPSDAVLKITKKLNQKKYASIAKMLTSENSAEKYMAVITLEKLDEVKEYKLSEIEKIRIKEVKQSAKMVSVCSGCTYMDTIELKKMFTSEMKSFAENWIDDHF